MFIGEYTHTVDDKKRISLPSTFRKLVSKKIIITRGLDSCLFLYTPEEWKKIAEELGSGWTKSDQRGIHRFIYGGAQEVSVDSIGRILIPEHLKKFADIKSKVVFAGVSKRIEIWDEKRWQAYKKGMEKQAEQLSEKLESI
ncbi:MAG: division/cell wall cluster transcriptional repressor MraZ [Candidatus Pacebacteria bacterium]|nr:division/cell wall cluster transcriptional repressor MraZ [Candidatus Paceibacterota bacterium]